MIGIAGNYHVASLQGGTFGEMLHASNKRAGCIDYFCGAFFEFTLHLRRHTVSANDGDCVGVRFVRRIDRRDAATPEPFHLLGVVNEWTKRANRPHTLID